MDRSTANEFKGQRVQLQTRRGACYRGLLVSTTPQSLCLTNLTILNKDGSYKATTGAPGGIKRDFKLDSVQCLCPEAG